MRGSWIPVVLAAAGIVIVGAVAWWWWNGPFGPVTPPYPFFWPIFPLGFFLVLIVAVVAARFAAWGWGGHPGWRPGADAREILRVRYARGEISRDQLRQMLQDLLEST